MKSFAPAITAIVTSTFLILTAQPVAAVTRIIPSPPAVNAKGYILMDYESGEVIASKNADTRLAPASLTKMMTAYVIGQEINSGRMAFHDEVTIGHNAWSQKFPTSSKMFIEPGDRISVANLSRGIMVQSGNDASVAMAEHIAGSEAIFVDLMNSWASKLGMINTQFTNAHGLDSANIGTSPNDMAILARSLIRDTPEMYAIYSERSFTWNGITQNNRNQLLWDKSLNVDGIKTGYTSDAGYSLVTSATSDDMRLISVVMGTPNPRSRIQESRALLTYGFRFYETDILFKAHEDIAQQPVWMGESDELTVTVNENIALTLPRNQIKNVQAHIEYQTPLKAPIKRGEVVGQASWSLDGKVLKEVPLVAAQSIEQGSFFKRLLDGLKLFFQNLIGSLF